MNKNYGVMKLGTFSEELVKRGRVMAEKELGLTSCELSFNALPSGMSIPFVHTHKLNEEVYIVLSGKGQFMVDEDEFTVGEGDIVRVAPVGKRTLKADETLTYICIQAQDGSLTQATHDDGVITEDKASWMKE